MEFDTIDTDLWSEIKDLDGEIFDILNMNEIREEFDLDGYLAADYDF